MDISKKAAGYTGGLDAKAGPVGGFRAQLKAAAGLQRELGILLSLSEELTNIRDREGFGSLLGSISRENPVHIALGLIQGNEENYMPFSSSLGERDGRELGYSSVPRALLDAAARCPGPFEFGLEDFNGPSRDNSHLGAYLELGLCRGMMVPLKSKMKTIGYIEVYARQRDFFSGPFTSIITGIAPQVANVVANILLNEQLAENRRIDRELIELSNKLIAVRNKRELLDIVNMGLKKFFGFSHSAIAIIDERAGFYRAFTSFQHHDGKDLTRFREAMDQDCPTGDGICDVALSEPFPLVLDAKMIDLRNSPLWYRFNYSLGIRETLIKVLPDASGNRFALLVFSQHAGTFDSQALKIIERIGDQLSSVANNIYTREKLANREREKAFLLDFSNAMARVRNRQELIDALGSSFKKLSIPVDMYAISKIDEDWKTISCYFHQLEVPPGLAAELAELEKARFAIHDGLQDRVLANSIPLIFSPGREGARDNAPAYLRFWQKMGFEDMMGTALRTGNTDLGIFWLATAQISPALLKGICAQLSVALSNIFSNEQLLQYKRKLEIENSDLQAQISTFYDSSEIIGSGEQMRKVYHLVNLVSASDTTVMISGETGTGKELIARAIHNGSSRSSKAMVKVNCAALPAELIESELFGHEKGSFTGAYEKRIGKFELAHQGTLFLDEIGEMPMELQVKLLRVLQEREFERIGGKETLQVDVRIIAATNRDLAAEVAAGKFRSDLYYRLHVFPMELPPLRARLEDLEALTDFFLGRYSKLTGVMVRSVSAGVMQRMRAYSWPGNIRELEHLIERSILLSTGQILNDIDLPANPPEIQGGEWQVVHHALEEAERAYILLVLKGCEGRISGAGGAAELLDLPASTLHSKMKKLGINRMHYSG